MSAPAGTGGTEGLEEWIDRLASRSPAPSGGSAAAIALAMACALGAMAARFSGSRFDTPEAIVEQLEAARATALSLAAADERAVESVFGSGRPEASAEELLQLVEVPGAIAHLAAELRPVLVTIADEGNPVVRGDAITGAELAGAAGRAALALLRLNADQMDEAQRSTVLDNATAIEPRLI